MGSRGKNRCGGAYYSWSSRESQERANVLQEVSPRAQPVSLLTAALVRLENS